MLQAVGSSVGIEVLRLDVSHRIASACAAGSHLIQVRTCGVRAAWGRSCSGLYLRSVCSPSAFTYSCGVVIAAARPRFEALSLVRHCGGRSCSHLCGVGCRPPHRCCKHWYVTCQWLHYALQRSHAPFPCTCVHSTAPHTCSYTRPSASLRYTLTTSNAS